MGELSASAILALGGLGIGLLFGAIVQATNFCTLGGVSDAVLLGDQRRLRAWALAAAVALIGTQSLHFSGAIDIDKSIYLTPNFGWAGAILGGLIFGFGMTKTGGCAGRTLARCGAGNLKSVIVLLIMGLVAYMTLRGIIAPLRTSLESATVVNLQNAGLKTQGLGDLLARVTGIGPDIARKLMAIVLGAGLLGWCFRDPDFRGSVRNIIAGVGIGLTVVLGWVVTGILGADEFAPVQLASLSFASPIAESLQYLMTFTGSTINFGIASVFGVITGAFLAAIATGTFRLEGFADRDDLARHMGGAVLMGVGAILSLGCTVGQAISGVSTLAMGGFITWAAIIAGAAFGIKHLEEGSYSGALKAVFARD